MKWPHFTSFVVALVPRAKNPFLHSENRLWCQYFSLFVSLGVLTSVSVCVCMCSASTGILQPETFCWLMAGWQKSVISVWLETSQPTPTTCFGAMWVSSPSFCVCVCVFFPNRDTKIAPENRQKSVKFLLLNKSQDITIYFFCLIFNCWKYSPFCKSTIKLIPLKK